MISVLVAYCSTNGSTAGIAETIVGALGDAGLAARAMPASQVRTLDGYDAIVLGGALYAGRWHRDARRFVRRHEKALRERPVWLFSSGPLDDSADTGDLPPVAGVAAVMRRVAARGHTTFGGRLTEGASGFIARAMVRNGRGGDFRDPARISAWAGWIAGELVVAEPIRARTDSPGGHHPRDTSDLM